MTDLLQHFKNLKNQKSLAILLDPDKLDKRSLEVCIIGIIEAKVDLVFVGGSLVSSDHFRWILATLKVSLKIPVILFPGHVSHIYPEADGILLLSLVSGRNPEYLIGQHVIAAPALKRSGLAIIPTAYLLVDGGKATTVSYMSNTTPIPADKPDLAVATAMAGEMLGLQLCYLDAGSGAQDPVSVPMIFAVSKNIDLPLIVGGGINTLEKARAAWLAGADIIVVGNAVESDPGFIKKLAEEKSKVLSLL
jgi:geranylgeranylglyceryl phosphate synthase family protein